MDNTEKKALPGVEPEADILTPEQVATWLQVNKSSIYKHKDQFGARKIAGAIRISKANVLKVLESGGLDRSDEQEKSD